MEVFRIVEKMRKTLHIDKGKMKSHVPSILAKDLLNYCNFRSNSGKCFQDTLLTGLCREICYKSLFKASILQRNAISFHLLSVKKKSMLYRRAALLILKFVSL